MTCAEADRGEWHKSSSAAKVKGSCHGKVRVSGWEKWNIYRYLPCWSMLIHVHRNRGNSNLSSLLVCICKLRHLGRKFCHSSKDLGAPLKDLAMTKATRDDARQNCRTWLPTSVLGLGLSSRNRRHAMPYRCEPGIPKWSTVVMTCAQRLTANFPYPSCTLAFKLVWTGPSSSRPS